MTEHVMVDLETLGTSTDSVILSIGAVKFDPVKFNTIIDRFHVRVHIGSCLRAGMKVGGNTIDWWFAKERDEARERLLAGEPLEIPVVLQGFAQWFGEDKPIWSCGSDFDCVILRRAYELCGIECPWGYSKSRCFRTIRDELDPERKFKPSWGDGVQHDALSDAVHQARWLQSIYAKTYLVAGKKPANKRRAKKALARS